jgi:Rv0078B-related antitoxin
MRAVFDLYELAEDMMRQNLRRQHPGASDAEIERRLLSWLRKETRHES